MRKILNVFGTHPLSLISIEEIKNDAHSACQAGLDHLKPAQDWQSDNTPSPNKATKFVAITACHIQVLPIPLWLLKHYNKVQKNLVMRLK